MFYWCINWAFCNLFDFLKIFFEEKLTLILPTESVCSTVFIFHTSFTPQTVFVRICTFLIGITQTDVLQKLLRSVYLGKVTSYVKNFWATLLSSLAVMLELFMERQECLYCYSWFHDYINHMAEHYHPRQLSLKVRLGFLQMKWSICFSSPPKTKQKHNLKQKKEY